MMFLSRVERRDERARWWLTTATSILSEFQGVIYVRLKVGHPLGTTDCDRALEGYKGFTAEIDRDFRQMA